MLIPKHPLSCLEKTLGFVVILFLLPTVDGSNCSDTSYDDNDDCYDENHTWTLLISLGSLFGAMFLITIYGILKHKYTLYKKRLSQSRSNKQAHVVEVSTSTKCFSLTDLSSDSPSHAQFGGIYYKPDFCTTTHAKYGGIEYGRPASTPTHAIYGGIQYGEHPSTPTHAQYGGFTYSPNPSANDTTRTKKFWKRVFKD